MALKKAHSKFGQEFPEAYHKVVETNLNWHEKRGKVTVNIWASKESREADEEIIDQKSWSFPIAGEIDEEGNTVKEAVSFEEVFGASTLDTEGVNPVKRTYEWLKTLDDYADATDT